MRRTRSAVRAAALLLALASSFPAVAGTIERIAVTTARLGTPLPALVYRPDGPAPADGFPVLTLLHGLGGSETDWLELGDIRATLDAMIAAGTIRPLLVVMPGAGSSWYVDTTDIGGPGDVPGAIVEDLGAAVEARYPARRDKGGRAVAGLSMGGYGALRLAFLHPGRYASVAALSPAIWQNVPPADFGKPPEAIALLAESGYFHRADAYTVTPGIDLPPAGPHFGGMYGDPFDPARFNAANVFTLLSEALAAKTPLPPVFVTVGDDDSHGLWRGAIALFETMKADGRPIAFRITDGDHVWALWKETIRDALAFADRQFTEVPSVR